MSKAAAQNFVNEIAGSEELRQALHMEIAQSSDPIDATSRFAQSHGYDVDPQDLRLEKTPQPGELGDDELVGVTGGSLTSYASRGIVIVGGSTSLGGSSFEEQGIIIVNS